MTLYEIDAELLTLIDEIEEAGGEVTDDQDARLDALLDARDDKADGYIAVIRQAETQADAVGAEIARLKAVQAAQVRTADRLKGRLLASMLGRGEDVLAGRLGKVRVQYASSRRVDVLADPAELPDRFRRVRVEPDKAALKAALEEQDPEAVRFAELAESRTPYVRIY